MAVTKLKITSRQPLDQGQAFGDVGAYEQLDGTAYLAVDPTHSANASITDLELAPRNAGGMVSFSADFRVLRPVEPERGNRRLFFDILNRGRGPALRNLNYAANLSADAPPDPGDGFLMRHGFTVAWCGWQQDAPDAPGVMRLDGPEAVNAEGPISGKLVVTFHPNSPTQVQFLSDRNHRPYPTNNMEDKDAVLTVQDHEDAPEQIVPRGQWSFARMEGGRVVPDASHVYMASGFTPGKVYQVIYSTTGAPIVGLGLLATRDMGAFLRYAAEEEGNPCGGGAFDHAYTFGVSQSGRFLRQFLYDGLNQDEEDRTVFDGFMPHVAGGKRGEFNFRFAQPSSQASRSPNNLFPFSDVEQTDPETGRTDGMLSKLAAQGKLPKVIYTYTSSEYWAGGGALVHIDLAGTRDMEAPDSVRIYHFAGAQHGVGTLQLRDKDPANGSHGQQPFNCVDYRPLLRAALLNLDRWVSSWDEPPPSAHPRVDNGTAVPPHVATATITWIPGVNSPEPLRRFRRLDFGPKPGVATNVPAVVGAPYSNLVPAVDQDGNDVCGVLMPIVTVPLASYTGWNLRHAGMGGEGQILSSGGATGGSLIGSTIPFPTTRDEREASGDPRPSIEERYSSKQDYLDRIMQAAGSMVSRGYLLVEDLETVLDQAGQHYDQLSSRVAEAMPAD
ncbi:MAG: hypothetical protein BZY88_09085 [SAR202 cluster bacterium Io17-Chloro-G9]|nr:MAG: hypothetical protein BZY88_09085 [SAR202 cluster bacterium Io17-Chloro-G9]